LKKVIYSKSLATYFYIKRLEAKVLIISIGADSPFEYIDILVSAIKGEADRIPTLEVDVYFDLLSAVGNNENRYLKLVFNKQFPSSFIDMVSHLMADDLPCDITLELDKFYAKHLKEVLRYSILSDKDKNKLLTLAIL
jgi:hypothetical protein